MLPEPFVADTLGWIHHLLGDDRTAAPQAARKGSGRLSPRTSTPLVHAAAIHAGLNDLVKARKDLDAAVKADPKAADRPDVKTLRDKIK